MSDRLATNQSSRRLVVAFDVDDTLIIPAVATGFDRDVPNYETIAVYRWFQAQGHEMIIWSGGGSDYARQWADKLGLTADWYLDKHHAARSSGPDDWRADLVFDDSDIELGRINVKVKRLNNKVIRYPERIATAKGTSSGTGVNIG